MRSFRHRSDYGPVEIKRMDLKNLIDDKNPWWQRHNTFGTWHKFFGPFLKGKQKRGSIRVSKNYLINKILRDIIFEFCKLMIEDLIYENDSYEFPGDQFARLQIGYVLPESRCFKYDFKTGKKFIPVLLFKEATFNKIKIQYYFGITKQWRDILQQEVEKGHKYQKPLYEYDRYANRESRLPGDHGPDRQSSQE